MINKLTEIIREQQKGFEKSPRFAIGEQLLDMASRDEKTAELLVRDLETDGMKLADAEKKLQAYSDKNRGTAKCFCITPKTAEGILREFYGLSEPDTKETAPTSAPLIDVGDFF